MVDNTEKPKVDIWKPRFGTRNKLFEDSTLRRQTVEFRNGKSLVVYEENQVIDEYILELEADLEDNPNPDERLHGFRRTYYSKLLACSVGDVPTDEEARIMPAEDLGKWIQAVRQINPNWFIRMDESMAKLSEEEKKRRPKRRRK